MEKDTLLVSVLMPVYNGEKFLKEAIDSILAQTYTNFELIIINDGSTDSSETIILSYTDKRIKYIKNEENLKLISTLNKGTTLANGKYIARMDADDVSLPNRLAEQVNYLEQNPSIVLCGSWAKLINENGEVIGQIKNIDSPNKIKCSLFFTCPIIHPSVMIRKEVLQKNPYSSTAVHCEDFELWCRFSNQNFLMSNLKKYLFKYRWHSSNISVENETFQIEQKKKILIPQLESFLNRPVTEDELNLHLYSFQLYRFNKKYQTNFAQNIEQEKQWLSLLSKQNHIKNKFPYNDFDALLLSRWIVCCIATKQYKRIWQIPILGLHISKFYKAFQFLINK